MWRRNGSHDGTKSGSRERGKTLNFPLLNASFDGSRVLHFGDGLSGQIRLGLLWNWFMGARRSASGMLREADNLEGLK